MRKSEKKIAENQNLANSTSFFANGFKFKGDINAHSDIRIEGIIEGNIKTSKKVIVGPSGLIIGNIKATDISLMGEVSGGIIISGVVNIGETAKISGSITADKIKIDPGAIIEASVTRFSASSHSSMDIKTVKEEIKEGQMNSKNLQLV